MNHIRKYFKEMIMIHCMVNINRRKRFINAKYIKILKRFSNEVISENKKDSLTIKISIK